MNCHSLLVSQSPELVSQSQQGLAQAMTKVEAMLWLLKAAGMLNTCEQRLDKEAGGPKAELFLQLLLAK